jgi:hypothetical protein
MIRRTSYTGGKVKMGAAQGCFRSFEDEQRIATETKALAPVLSEATRAKQTMQQLREGMQTFEKQIMDNNVEIEGMFSRLRAAAENPALAESHRLHSSKALMIQIQGKETLNRTLGDQMALYARSIGTLDRKSAIVSCGLMFASAMATLDSKNEDVTRLRDRAHEAMVEATENARTALIGIKDENREIADAMGGSEVDEAVGSAEYEEDKTTMEERDAKDKEDLKVFMRSRVAMEAAVITKRYEPLIYIDL